MNRLIQLTLLSSLTFCGHSVAQELEVRETGKSPALKVAIVSPGIYKAVVSQEAGGGIMEFYDLVQDPQAKWNLAGWDRGLFEVCLGTEFKWNR